MSLKWGGGTWPGSLSTCVNGHVFIEIDIFEVDASAIKSHLYYKKKREKTQLSGLTLHQTEFIS